MDCGTTCLRMVAKSYGKSLSAELLRQKADVNREGTSMRQLAEVAEWIGLRSMVVKIPLNKIEEIPLPCILHWDNEHFVVLHNIEKKANGKSTFAVADPARGQINYSAAELFSHWEGAKGLGQGICLLMQPTPDFYSKELEQGGDSQDTTEGVKLTSLWKYVSNYKKLFREIILGLVLTSIFALITPFITQSVVDIGINTQNIRFVTMMLVAQLMLFFGRVSIEFLRSWLLLHISSRLSISLLSSFFKKLFKLPAAYFDKKMTGDIMQRVNDHEQIQNFLTGSTLSSIFSVLNLIIFGIILGMYDLLILAVFVVGSVLYAGWVLLFMKKRRAWNFSFFGVSAHNQNAVVQLLEGMQEIKLANAETEKRWEWEGIQSRLYDVMVEGLALNQYQEAGALFINELKNILISFLTVYSVIEGDLTLGAMMAVQYIIGNLNGPIEQLIQFLQSFQDAKISLERLNEVHATEDEEPEYKHFVNYFPTDKSIKFENISFSYTKANPIFVLKKINLTIPEGKTTAIVGASGSGKTTLLKLLLKFYDPTDGQIYIGSSSLDRLSHRLVRKSSGVVMQDGYIFSSSILKNITVGFDRVDYQRLDEALEIANIKTFTDGLALGIHTKIGADGVGLSQGQKQRLLIARAVYKDPTYLFLDEATNALDANNERAIQEKLTAFFENRTVLMVAHRLSTVKNAHQIIVLQNGEISEIGTHDELTAKRGEYYELIKNQLELGT